MNGFRFERRAHISGQVLLAAGAALVFTIMLLGAVLGQDSRMLL